jgi:hypothetical protein
MYWRIWFELYEGDKKIGAGVWHYKYKYKGNATRAAIKRFGEPRVNKNSGKTYKYKWTVSQTNPWVKKEE